jgi:glutathione synthase/RimK-type ligase-like ATP-grasp enzyme
MGLNFAGVDILLDPDKQEPVVIELNAFPGFPKVRTFNLAKYLIREIGGRRWK